MSTGKKLYIQKLQSHDTASRISTTYSIVARHYEFVTRRFSACDRALTNYYCLYSTFMCD